MIEFQLGHSLLRPGGRSYGDLVHLPNARSLCVRCARVFQRFALGGVDVRSLVAADRGLKTGYNDAQRINP